VNREEETEHAPILIKLSDREWKAFVAALDNPLPPNAALKDLLREFGPWKAQPGTSDEG
jgi:uncharacterized protein (DUF1778 family)